MTISFASKYQILIQCRYTNSTDYFPNENLTIGPRR